MDFPDSAYRKQTHHIHHNAAYPSRVELLVEADR